MALKEAVLGVVSRMRDVPEKELNPVARLILSSFANELETACTAVGDQAAAGQWTDHRLLILDERNRLRAAKGLPPLDAAGNPQAAAILNGLLAEDKEGQVLLVEP